MVRPVLVDELLIPHPEGAVQVRFDERVTVLAGLDPRARERFAHLLASGLAGVGPATVLVRDDLGERGRIEPGTTAPDAVDEVRRLCVVGAAELGVRHELPPPVVAAERTAVAIAHRQVVRELAAVEAGAAERSRLLAEIGAQPEPAATDAPEGAGGTRPAATPDLDAVAASAPRIDELLARRRSAGDLLERTTALLRSVADDPTRPSPPAAGDLRIDAGALATQLLAAVDVVRRVSGATADVGTDRRRAETDARLALARARAEIDQARATAEAEIRGCDGELAALARSADVVVGPEGPGAALTAALVQRRHVPGDPMQADDMATRLLARRRASLRARMAELPDDAEVAATRRRLDAVADRLARLDAGPGADVERTREALLGRIARLRPDGIAAIAPLVLDEALVGLEPDDLCDLLDLLVRVAERTQVVLLTGDPAIATWARHRSAGGQLRLIDLARVSAGESTAIR
jgi:hypothetical protein